MRASGFNFLLIDYRVSLFLLRRKCARAKAGRIFEFAEPGS